MNNPLKFKSMEELSRLARNEGEDKTLRVSAQNELERREKAFRCAYDWKGPYRCMVDYIPS